MSEGSALRGKPRLRGTLVGKPCVLLTGGYNPERVAHAVMNQASDRLCGTADGG